MPKVSILVPVYNASQWLRHCLDSIVGQTYGYLQVVFVDNVPDFGFVNSRIDVCSCVIGDATTNC